MFPLSRARHPRAAFSAIRTFILRHNYLSSHVDSRHPSTLSSCYRHQPIHSHPFHPPVAHFDSLALPSHSLRFDKVPNRLPDWWDDDDDDEEDIDEAYEGGSRSKGGRGGGGGGGGGGGDAGGGGDWDDGTDKGLFATIIAIYTRAIHKAPIRTKAISTCLLALLGDYFAQRIAHHDVTFFWDRRRSASVGIWGLCFMGPMLHAWYGLLDRLFFGRFSVWQKLVSDQILFAPCFNAAFIAGIGSLEGMSPKEVTSTLKSKLWPSMKANWTLWPAAQFVNFAFIPKTFQIVYVNCVALFWNAILTYISHDRDEKDFRHGD